MPSNILLLIYNSLFLSNINYCISCWGYGPLDRLTKIQKKALRIITKSKYNAHSSPLFNQLNTLKVDDIFKIMSLKIYYKFQNEKLPLYFNHFPFKMVTPPVADRQPRIRTLTICYTDSQERLPILNPIIATQQTEKILSRNRIKHFIPELINRHYITENELRTTSFLSLSGFTYNINKFIINNYDTKCKNTNCYTCLN